MTGLKLFSDIGVNNKGRGLSDYLEIFIFWNTVFWNSGILVFLAYIFQKTSLFGRKNSGETRLLCLEMIQVISFPTIPSLSLPFPPAPLPQPAGSLDAHSLPDLTQWEAKGLSFQH